MKDCAFHGALGLICCEHI